jgi:hypothetical protein
MQEEITLYRLTGFDLELYKQYLAVVKGEDIYACTQIDPDATTRTGEPCYFATADCFALTVDGTVREDFNAWACEVILRLPDLLRRAEASAEPAS